MRCSAGLTVQAREIERVAEEVGRQVEPWLAAEQKRILQAAPTPAPAHASDAKFYISFDGTGVPVRNSELVGRRGQQADGSAPTREAQLGCVFHPSRLGPIILNATLTQPPRGAIRIQPTLRLPPVRRGFAPGSGTGQDGDRADRRSA